MLGHHTKYLQLSTLMSRAFSVPDEIHLGLQLRQARRGTLSWNPACKQLIP